MAIWMVWALFQPHDFNLCRNGKKTISLYLLVNVYITMERSTIVHGKTRVISMAMASSSQTVNVMTRGYIH